jgi:hypothetical protein
MPAAQIHVISKILVDFEREVLDGAQDHFLGELPRVNP